MATGYHVARVTTKRGIAGALAPRRAIASADGASYPLGMAFPPPPPGTIDTSRRHAAITGDGPRIAPVDTRALSPDLRALLTRMESISTAIGGRDPLSSLLDEPPPADLADRLAALPEITRMMVHYPALFTRCTDLGVHLILNGALAPRDRELAVLRIAWLCQAPYEWGEHVLVARTMTDLTPDEIDRITHGADAPGWTEDDRAILRAVEELHADAMITDGTWAMLAARLDARQLIELPILVGQYQCVAYYQNALRVRLHPGNAGLDAR